jgi:hypothetical protein
MASGQEGLVENQQRFRVANERLNACVRTIVEGDQLVPFLCECADGSCVARVLLTLTEYRDVRSDDSRFAILPGHAMVPGEGIVAQNELYAVVEKPSL